MKSLSPSIFVFLLFSLLVQVSGLELILQPQTLVGGTSVVFYATDPSDPPNFTFDLHFACPNGQDRGVAYTGIVISPGQTTGAVPVVFPSAGAYTVQAVISGQSQVISTSNVVDAVAPLVPISPIPIIPTGHSPSQSVFSTPSPTSLAAPSPTSIPSQTTLAPSSPTPSPSSSSTTTTAHVSSSPPSHPQTTAPHVNPTHTSAPIHKERKVNLPAVVGGVVGALAFLGLLAALIVFLVRRRRAAPRRYTFHQDMMVQPRTEVNPSVPPVTVLRNESPPSFGRDLEAGPPPPSTTPRPMGGPPKKLILASTIAPLRNDRDRPKSPMTPRTKRNFADVASNPFNTSAENLASAGPRTGIPASLTPGPSFPVPALLAGYGSEPFNPFQDTNRVEPEMTQVPPSPRVPSSAMVVPSPKGPRPSISRRGGNSSEASSSSSRS